MFDQNQLGKLVSVLNTVLEQNQADLQNLEESNHLKDSFKNTLQGKMQALQSAASIAINAIKQLQDLKQEKESLENANRNLKTDLFDLCDVNDELETQMHKLKEHVELQKEQLSHSEKTQQIIHREKEQLEKQLNYRMKKNSQKKQTYQQKQNNALKSRLDLQNKQNQVWKEKYNENVSHIKKELQDLRKATSDLRKKITQNQSKIKSTLKSKKSRQQLLDFHENPMMVTNAFKKKETPQLLELASKNNSKDNNYSIKVQQKKSEEVELDNQTQHSETSNSRVRKLSSFDNKMLCVLVDKLLNQNKIEIMQHKKQQNKIEEKAQQDSYVDKLIRGLEIVDKFLFQTIVKNRIKSGIHGQRRIQLKQLNERNDQYMNNNFKFNKMEGIKI